MPNKERIDFYFRCQVGADSKNGVLLDYWQSEETEMPLREMILSAGLAYWLPFAYKRLGYLEADELKQVVRSSIYQLTLHIMYLRNSFTFDDESLIDLSENSKARVFKALRQNFEIFAKTQLQGFDIVSDSLEA